jgi:hypothetical protein
MIVAPVELAEFFLVFFWVLFNLFGEFDFGFSKVGI